MKLRHTAQDWKQELAKREQELTNAQIFYDIAAPEELEEATELLKSAKRKVKIARTKVFRLEAAELAAQQKMDADYQHKRYLLVMQELGQATAEMWAAENALVEARKRHAAALTALEEFEVVA